MPTPRLDNERIALWRQLDITVSAVRRAIDHALMEDHDLPLAWFDVLAALRDANGAIRVGALRDRLDEVPSSLSRRLDRMEEAGLIEREPAPKGADRRAVAVILTREGRLSWRDASVTFRRALQQHLASRLTDTDISALHRVIGKAERRPGTA